MIEQLQCPSRKLLIACRAKAMQGHVETALAELGRKLFGEERIPVIDQIALGMARAELLYLDGRAEESFALFEKSIDPVLGAASGEIALTVADNRNVIAMSLVAPKSASDFYDIYDHLRLAGIQRRDLQAIIEADEAARKGRHYESLPAVWRELIRAYHSGNWRALHWASERMSLQCLHLGLPDEAVYHGIVAQNRDMLEAAGDFIVARRDPTLASKTIDKLLAVAHLQCHFCVACYLIRKAYDVIPDSQVSAVFEWLITRCKLPISTLRNPQTSMRAWETLLALVRRLKPDEARRAVSVAVSHEGWKKPSLQRANMIDCVNGCVALINADELDDVAEASLPLATDAKADHDYGHALNLLGHIAQRGTPDIKARLANALYPPGKPTRDLLLAQLFSVFGKKPASKDEISRAAEKVAHDIRLQVQRLKPEEEPQTVSDSYGNMASTKDGQKIVVQMLSGTRQLQVAANERDLIKARSFSCLIDAVLEMVEEPENAIANKSTLIDFLAKVSDRFTKTQASRVFRVLRPLAEGHVAEPSAGMTAAQARDPLNPFKMNMGDPDQIPGLAIYALALTEKARPGVYGREMDKLLVAGLSSANGPTRLGAIIAAGHLPKLSAQASAAMLMATRDHDPKVAASAFRVIATTWAARAEQTDWQLLAHSLRMAMQSASVELRRAAALAVGDLVSSAPHEEVRQEMGSLAGLFAQDACHSVRMAAAATGGQSTESGSGERNPPTLVLARGV